MVTTTGMRRGEILGIGDSTLNLKNCSLTINQAARHRTGVGVFLNDPKSEKSCRIIPFPPSIVPLIEELIKARNKQRISCGDLWHDKIATADGKLIKNDLLFTQWNGKAMHPNSIDTWFSKFKKDNGLPENLTFHGLRHTNIKLLLKAGVDISTVSDNSGHAKRSTTLDYDDPSPEALREVPQKIDSVLNLQETVAGLLNLPVNVRRKGKKTD
jgi:integrase